MSLFELDQQQPLERLSPLNHLYAYLATCVDKSYEKKPFGDRIVFGKDYYQSRGFDKTYDESEVNNLAQLRSTVSSLDNAFAGKPVHAPISLDAAASGLQMLAAMSNCQMSWYACTGSPSMPSDAYTYIYENSNIQQQVPGVTRKQLKRAIMTAFYGSTGIPKEIFGDKDTYFYAALCQFAPAAWDLCKSFLAIYGAMIENDKITHTRSWVLPDNHYASQTTTHKLEESYTFLGKTYQFQTKIPVWSGMYRGTPANVVHSVDAFVVREIIRRTSPHQHKSAKDCPETVEVLQDLYDRSGFMSVKILNHLGKKGSKALKAEYRPVVLDLVKTLPAKRFEVIPVHDAFRVLPHYGDEIRRQYNFVMAQLVASDMSKFLHNTLHPDFFVNHRTGYLTPKEVIGQNYAIA